MEVFPLVPVFLEDGAGRHLNLGDRAETPDELFFGNDHGLFKLILDVFVSRVIPGRVVPIDPTSQPTRNHVSELLLCLTHAIIDSIYLKYELLIHFLPDLINFLIT